MKHLSTIICSILFLVTLTACTSNNDTIRVDSYSSEITSSFVGTNDNYDNYENDLTEQNVLSGTDDISNISFDITSVPDYSGEPVYIVNNNLPYFTENDITTKSFELYSDLDVLGRAQTAFACLSKDTMPFDGEERGAIGNIKPTGWHTIKYPDVINDNYLYNRCHLIGWQLCAENDNEKNLVTGTRYLNVDGMLPYENQVDDYIEATNNHVMYRVTPVYEENNLVCDGILIEAQSVEDNSCVFCVYCYNVQPYITIDYTTGESWLTSEKTSDTENINNDNISQQNEYVLNTNSMKIHKPDCQHVESISPQNKLVYNGSISELDDYTPCKVCNPF